MNVVNQPSNTVQIPSRSNYPQDNLQVKSSGHVYEGRVRTIEDLQSTGRSIREIDGCIILESVDSKTREQALQVIHGLKSNNQIEISEHQSLCNHSVFEIGTGITAIAAGIGIGITLSVGLVPALIAGIAGTILTTDGISRYRASSSNIQAAETDLARLNSLENEWRDPLPELVEKRKLAGKLGFNYAITNLLKNTLLHPDEVKQLWTDNFRSLIISHADIDKVYHEDLLGQATISYAFEHSPIPAIPTSAGLFAGSRVQSLSSQYRQWRDAYRIAAENKNSCLNALQKQSSQAEERLAMMRGRWMLPAEQTYRLGKENATNYYLDSIRPYRLERDRSIAEAKQRFSYQITDPYDTEEAAYKHQLDRQLADTINRINQQYHSHPEIIEIKARYAYDMRMHDFLYNQSRNLVDSYFDNQLRQLHMETEMAQSQILSQFQSVKGQLASLLDKILVAQEPPLSPYDFAVAPIRQNWSISDFCNEPSWNIIYGSRPQFQPHFSDHVLQDDWNYFWGDHGLGFFASRPIDRWNQVSREHIFTRRYPARRIPQQGLFMQPITLPVYTRSIQPRMIPGGMIPGAGIRERVRVTPSQGPTIIPERTVNRQPAVPVQIPPSAPRVAPGMRSVTAMGTTTRRTEVKPVPATMPAHASSAPRVAPGMRNVTAMGTTTRRTEVKPVPATMPSHASSAPRVAPGMRTTSSYGGTKRR